MMTPIVMPANRPHSGFTLVELSIVLVILGLLVGGVLSGQSLIRAAELRSVTTQFDSYRVALNSFRDKYFALPGDMPNATRFWTSAGGDGSNAACLNAQTSGSKATCNGNGDGKILTFSATASSATEGMYSERFTAWKHLSNAGLIEGAYSGVNGPAAGGTIYNSYILRPGENLPIAKLSQGVLNFYYMDYKAAHNFAGTSLPSNTMNIIANSPPGFGIVKPEEAWNIDTKLDDGSPVTGFIFNYKQSSSESKDCTTGDTDTATYDVLNTGRVCMVHTKI